MKSPNEIMREEMGYWISHPTAKNIADDICKHLMKEGWYFTWCQQKYEMENKNASQD